MEIDQGDLADIVRASGSGAAGQSSTTITTTVTTTNNAIDDWKYPSDEAANFPSNTIDATSDEFGDPFMAARDPLLHELDLPAAGPVFFDSQPYSTGGGSFLAHKILADSDQRMIKTPPNMFSRMLQISPSTKIPAVSPTSANSSPALMSSDSPRGIKTSSLVMNDMIQAASTSGVCMVDSGGMQISSARNPGIKRRKSQAKKVVCIPAPAAANNRPTGEVVPSDLWAWRKYGQKPIKGSPYPRGYYRCSSSKGCSARKQVERSRTDPNMLVITYTSEHNHPWPTQRNALAGSTRSQPIKNTAAASSKGTPSANTQNKPTVRKEEPRENNHQYGNTITSSTVIHAANDQSRMTDEMIKEEHAEAEKAILDPMEDEEIVHGFQQSYKPVPLADSAQPDDFFFDLAELEPDPLNLIFCQGLSGEKNGQEKENKAEMDPFSLFDWSGNSFGDS